METTEFLRRNIKEGDRVLLPDGHPATVADIDYPFGGVVTKCVTVRPEGGFWTRQRYALKGWLRWWDEKIDRLRLEPTLSDEELRAIDDEIEDCLS